ncbi:MAG: hypothetical protein HKN04_04195 [Rhodothermaceae bacterium]|nr:hypothetical protein [Rhodothermaceae bacterium]
MLVFSACGTTRSDAERNEAAALQVVSFNLRLNIASDSADAWPYRREAAIALLRGADLVGVQEALPDMLTDLDERLPHLARIGVGREADGGGEYSAILYRADRLTCSATGHSGSRRRPMCRVARAGTLPSHASPRGAASEIAGPG